MTRTNNVVVSCHYCCLCLVDLKLELAELQNLYYPLLSAGGVVGCDDKVLRKKNCLATKLSFSRMPYSNTTALFHRMKIKNYKVLLRTKIVK